jgi:drug/metabolite transporter (DMT)-like permease
MRRDSGRIGVERETPPDEDPHVPEFALAAGVAIALTVVAGGVLLDGGLRATVVLAALALLPFLAYAVRHSDDPTTVLPPRPIAAVAGLLALVLLADALLTEGLAGLPAGLALAVGFSLPALAYLSRYDGPPLRPRTAALASVAVAGSLLLVGLALSNPILGAAAALAVGLSGARYAVAGGLVPSRRARRRVVGALVVAGVAVVALGVAGGGSPGLAVAGVTLALGGGLFGAVSRPSRKS